MRGQKLRYFWILFLGVVIIMSIVLRANQLNTLIYKYLLEAGLNHTAFTLFNEALLAQPLQEFKFDVRAGHLLSLLEKGLVYTQIEAHTSLSEYKECNEPFYLLKPHTCSIVDRAKKDKEQLLRELGNQINDSIKRTNSVYNAAITNRDYDDIVYDAKGLKYFQKFPKIRIPVDGDIQQQFVLQGTDQAPLLHNLQDFEIDMLRYDTLNDQMEIDQIFPCISEGKFEYPLDFTCAGEFLVQLYPNNRITAFKLRNDNLEPIQFKLQGSNNANKMLPNETLPHLLTVTGPNQFWVINLNTLKIIHKGEGIFAWRDYDEYVCISQNSIHLKSLCENGNNISFPTENQWDLVLFNPQKILYALISYKDKLIHVYTFDSTDPLFIFDLKENKQLKQVFWITSNSVDYLCWLTQTQIKIFDISLNAYSKIIDISEYDSGVSKLTVLLKSDRNESFLIALGTENLLVYDVTNAKIERIEVVGKAAQLFSLPPEKLALVMQNCIYFLTSQYIEPIFK